MSISENALTTIAILYSFPHAQLPMRQSDGNQMFPVHIGVCATAEKPKIMTLRAYTGAAGTSYPPPLWGEEEGPLLWDMKKPSLGRGGTGLWAPHPWSVRRCDLLLPEVSILRVITSDPPAQIPVTFAQKQENIHRSFFFSWPVCFLVLWLSRF